MEVLVCVKRVPMVGGRIVLTSDGQDVDTRMAGFTISPHEECAVEEAVQITGRLGGAVSVLTLGSEASIDQLRDCLSVGADRAILLETDGTEFGPIATADAIAGEVRLRAETGPGYDLVLLGNEAADTGDYQIGVRLAHLLGWPAATGIKAIDVGDSGGTGAVVRARRQYRGADEVFELALPAVVTVKEGINLPRYPSLPGRLRAKRAEIERRPVTWQPEGLRKQGLRVPAAARQQSTVLGTGVAAVPALVGLLGDLGVLP